MAVGGMIGGGIYTLAGVLLGTAGALAWLSLALGGALALVTVRGYARLVIATDTDAVPISVFERDHRVLAIAFAWGLVVVYVLALAVYTFTLGHYLGRMLGLGEVGMAVCEAIAMSALLVVNLRGVQAPAKVQTVIVWVVLAIFATIAIVGLARWSSETVTRGAPEPSAMGVIMATCTTFIAFEGFEMLAYDVREVARPRRVLRRQLPRAVIVVALVYAFVTMGAASLVGADVLIQHEDNALAMAGQAIAGQPGMIVVSVAACASATAAINATLFSTARLARNTAERGLLPSWCARCNPSGAPTLATVVIGTGAVAVAATFSLRPLVAAASLGFLVLFCIVNATTALRLRRQRELSIVGAVAAGLGAIVVSVQLVRGAW
jgi:amino acid transporter